MTDLITRDPNDTGEIARPLADQTATALAGEVTRDLSGRTVHIITDAPHETAVLPMPPTVGVYERFELTEATARLFRSEPPPLRTADPDADSEPMPHREGVALPEERETTALDTGGYPPVPPPPPPPPPSDMAAAQPVAPWERVGSADTGTRMVMAEKPAEHPIVRPRRTRRAPGGRHRPLPWWTTLPAWAVLGVFAALAMVFGVLGGCVVVAYAVVVS